MRTIVIVLAFIVSVYSCSSSPSVPEAPPPEPFDFWDTRPIGDELFFLGAAGVRLNMQEAVDFALEDAARRVAFFQSIGGTISHHENIGSGFFDYSSENENTLQFDEEYKNYIDALSYDPDTDVFTENQAVFVRTRYRSANGIALEYTRNSQGGKPRWVDNPPGKISGFLAGVGFAGPRLYYKDTVVASYENAVFSIIKSVSNEVTSLQETTRFSGNSFSSATVINNETSASGTLKGFYVLDTWTDPATRAVWTLAIAREGS
jgi:hypothetical protein